MPRKPPVDVGALIRELSVSEQDSRGWRLACITYGPPHPNQQGTEGLVDPGGVVWEIMAKWAPHKTSDQVAKAAKHITSQRLGGYDFRLVYLGGEVLLAERYSASTALRIWDGLRLAGEWVDFSIAGCPWQMQVDADWTHPGGDATERVVLYVRWRSWGLDPEGTLWQGFIYRYDPRKEGRTGFLRGPSSPNLLPTLAPRDAPAEPPTKGILFFAPTTSPDVGFTEDQEAEAKRCLFEKADAWLREHGENPDAWIHG